MLCTCFKGDRGYINILDTDKDRNNLENIGGKISRGAGRQGGVTTNERAPR